MKVKRGVKFINSDGYSKASANAPAKRFGQSNRNTFAKLLIYFSRVGERGETCNITYSLR